MPRTGSGMPGTSAGAPDVVTRSAGETLWSRGTRYQEPGTTESAHAAMSYESSVRENGPR